MKKVGFILLALFLLLFILSTLAFAIEGSSLLILEDRVFQAGVYHNGMVAESEPPTFAPTHTKEQQADEIRRMINTYSPSGRFLLNSEATYRSRTENALISAFISEWIVVFKSDDIFSHLNTAVHEMYHSFQHAVWTGTNNLVNNDIVTIAFLRDEIVKTEEVTSKFPDRLKTFRWATYVSPGVTVTANVSGAYGLLDELSAYYYGCRAVIDCTEYLCEYIDKSGYSSGLVMGYFNSIWNDTSAFYEFEFWILAYLSFLKEHYPAHYEAIMGNENYKKVFGYIHDSFEKLFENIPETNKIIFDKLNSINIVVREDNDVLWLGNRGFIKPTQELEMLKKELSDVKYQIILQELAISTPQPTPPTTAQQIPDNAVSATPTASIVLVNGAQITFDAYNICGNNYFKLRDIAMALSGSVKQFEVSWNEFANAILLSSGQPYTPVGGELISGGADNWLAIPTESKVYLDGWEVQITAYYFGGNNYYKLRDIGAAVGFSVEWDAAAGAIIIDTSTEYTEAII